MFTWSSAMRAVKRMRKAGNSEAYIKKKWYGWIVIDPAYVINKGE